MPGPENPAGCPAGVSNLCSRRHWSIYLLLTVLAVVPVGWRTATVGERGVGGESPIFSANDRSRWAAVASLVEHRTWSIDSLIERQGPVRWDTIDKVQHAGQDGVVRSYSSKPPLLSAVVAGEYWLLRAATGLRLSDDPVPVVRTILTFNHVLGMTLLMVMLASLLEPLFVSDWTRYFVVATAGWGTFLTSFAVTLNNHFPAAVVTLAVVWLLDRIRRRPAGSVRWRRLFGLGVLASLNVMLELPAAALLGMVAVMVVVRWPKAFFAGFLPGAALMAAAAIGLNVWSNGSWRPAYSFRSDGAVLLEIKERADSGFDQETIRQLGEGELSGRLAEVARDQMAASGNPGRDTRMSVEPGTWMGIGTTGPMRRWIVTNPEGQGLFAIQRLSLEGTTGVLWRLHAWGNWYDYPGSYWRVGAEDRRSRVDRGEANRLEYALHFLVGHHGVLSLTPVWLLAFGGMIPLMFSRVLDRRWLGSLALFCTVAVIGFYLSMPAHERNYGGWTSGPRWLFWLIPLWLAGMVPVVQMLAGSRWGRGLCLVLLAASMLSGMYSWDNPWVQPWLCGLWTGFGLDQ